MSRLKKHNEVPYEVGVNLQQVVAILLQMTTTNELPLSADTLSLAMQRAGKRNNRASLSMIKNGNKKSMNGKFKR